MRRNRHELVGRVVLVRAAAERGEELLVPALGRRRDVFDVGEHAARAEEASREQAIATLKLSQQAILGEQPR